MFHCPRGSALKDGRPRGWSEPSQLRGDAELRPDGSRQPIWPGLKLPFDTGQCLSRGLCYSACAFRGSGNGRDTGLSTSVARLSGYGRTIVF
jgi:hypothetical protein